MASNPPAQKKEPVELIIEHYQKTYEVTHELWRERNNTFLVLVAFLAGATLLFSLGQPQANSLLVLWIAKTVGITDQPLITALQNSATFDLLQVLVLAVVFYLIVNLYHRTQNVLRLYDYLGKIESEIRQGLELANDSVSFTRESTSYWSKRPRLLGFVAGVYIVILFLLLGGFLGIRLIDDLQTGFNLFKIADLILAIAIAVYFVGYTRASLRS